MNARSLFLRPAVMVGGAVFEREESAPFVYQLHRHDHLTEMFYIDSGEGEFSIDGKSYKADAGTLLFYQQDVWHAEHSTVHPFRGMYIAFIGLEMKGLPTNFFLQPDRAPILKLKDQAPAFARRFRHCIREFSRNEPEAHTFGTHLLGILLARLARIVHYRDPVASQKSSQAVVLRARQYIEENYDKPVTLEILSRETYSNEYYLAHLFKEEVGISPIQYLIKCRMEVAKRYLFTSDYSVRYIAGLVGYQSENTFHGMFKKATGLTPIQFRKQSDGN
ncbi:AraC family transcriptional regulator [Cohnella sp. LGH]|uniref:AraC family transcriptional regulator n=1 Tax=unclassified Cohnella TaxID=2636738 RepID=UPI001ADB8059|nr:helix-turn-helix domain-containing protein [Cohnella sp. LGH]QTH42814.1 AraC family transcriptional regulator [Cohnella sp. LGH]